MLPLRLVGRCVGSVGARCWTVAGSMLPAVQSANDPWLAHNQAALHSAHSTTTATADTPATAAATTTILPTGGAAQDKDAAQPDVVSCHLLPTKLQLTWANGKQALYSFAWLRDHCPQSYHETSLQRAVNTVLIPPSIRPASVSLSPTHLTLNWEHGTKNAYDSSPHASSYRLDWLYANRYGFDRDAARAKCFSMDAKHPNNNPITRIVPMTWRGDTFHLDAHSTAGGTAFPHQHIFTSLLRDGIVMVTDMPTDRDGIKHILQQFGLLRRTFYADDVWSLKPVNPEDVNDTAMTTIMLPPHTDCSYNQNPPGLQLFSCIQNEATGGRSWFVDGRAIYEDLKQTDPEAAQFFRDTPLTFQAIEENIYVKATGTVFTVNERDELTMFRYNNDDRAPLVDMSSDTVDAFYAYLPSLVRTMQSDRLGYRVKIQPNAMVVVDNHRCLHAREAFTGVREFVGAYVDMDHFHSQCRLHGLELYQ